VLVSGTNFIVGYHLCGGRVQNVAVFAQAEGCAMEQLPPCHRKMTKSCCEDKEVFHEGDDIKSAAVSFDLSVPFIGEQANAPVLITEVINHEAPFFFDLDYDPPIPLTDLTVSLQVFLI
jgi:hypothetical protein